MALTKNEIEEIVNDNYDSIYKLCAAKCMNSDDALEITQEVFSLFISKAQTLEDKNLKAWLRSVAYYKIKEHIRANKKRKRFLSFEESESFLGTEISEADETTEEEFEQLLNETQKKILEVLTPQEKTIFIKRYIEKKSIKVVADELNTTEENIRAHSSRIKKKGKKVISTTELLINVIFFKIFHIFL